jgi:hypothetical protein
MSIPKRALELIEQDKWDESHNLVQDGNDKLCYLVHALLHRIEGDLSNAGYWYDRADEAMPENTIAEETERLKGLV